MNKVKTKWDLFKETIWTLAPSQGFYSRLKAHIQDMNGTDLEELRDNINNLEHDFKDQVDVVLFLEGGV